jgi:hypothetical protein
VLRRACSMAPALVPPSSGPTGGALSLQAKPASAIAAPHETRTDLETALIFTS